MIAPLSQICLLEYFCFNWIRRDLDIVLKMLQLNNDDDNDNDNDDYDDGYALRLCITENVYYALKTFTR